MSKLQVPIMLKRLSTTALLGLALGSVSAHESSVATALDEVEVKGHYDNAIGTSDAASQGVVGPELLRNRAALRPADVLEYIPGMVVTQHSGDGKANQYFLRGMNLDHGTDFATSVNGVPVNMPSHAHGQGYSDLNFLIPELVSRVEYRKGPYFASEGDFSSAGSASFVYRSKLDRPLADVTIGQRGYLRALVAGSREVSEGVTLLSALEQVNNNGPWSTPEALRKLNAQFILSSGSPREGWSTSLSAYSASWNSTDQVPQRLIDAGTYQGQPFGRFDTLDASDGAKTRRTSWSGNWHQSAGQEMTQLNWYAVSYSLDLFSNFTYSLERATDQFAQMDQRTVVGGKAFKSWFTDLGDQQSMQNTLGLQVRQDRIKLGLFDTTSRQIQSTVRDDAVNQTLVGVYGENEVGWNSWFRTVAGVRADQFNARVSSAAQSLNSGTSSGSKISPKLSLIAGPWQKTEFFLNLGKGFHSNDARGATGKVDAAPALVSSRGQEVGIKSQLVPDLQTSLAFWRLDFDSELVYVGDTGNTQAGRPSRRTGVEWSNHWTPGEHLLMDANLAWTHPRYSDNDPIGNNIPNAVQKVASLNLALKNLGPWSVALGVRYVGAAPLIENNAVRSASSVTTHLRVNRKLSNDVDVSLDVLNLTDRHNNDISYYYRSRVAGEPSALDGLHVHPAEPRALRVSARMRF
jgi:outer membrane cobalamin receptor